MFLRRLSAAVVIVTCFGWAAMGAAPDSLTAATNTGKEKSALAPQTYGISLRSITNITCRDYSNGAVEFNVIDGIGPFQFQLVKDGNIVNAWAANPAKSFTGLGHGDYVLWVRDQGNANSTKFTDFTLDNPAELTLSLVGNVLYPSCSGDQGAISVQANGSTGYTYHIDDLLSPYSKDQVGNGVFSGLTTGKYQLSVTDGKDCEAVLPQAIDIKTLDPINFTHTVISQIQCENQFATVQLNNLPADPFDIVVRNTSNNRTNYTHTNYRYTNLDAGNYAVTVTRRSCPADTKTENFTIEEFNLVTISTDKSSPLALNCSNDVIDVRVTVNGGNASRRVKVVFDNKNGIPDDPESGFINYGSSFSFTGLAAGSYTMRWVDENNSATCNGSSDFNIVGPATPVTWATVPVATSPLCYGGDGSISMSATGGTGPYTYYINGTLATANVVKPVGTYQAYAQDANGCKTAEVTVDVLAVPELIVTHNTASDKNVTCPLGNDGEINITISGGVGGYNYDLSLSGSPTTLRERRPTTADLVIGSLEKGIYDVFVRDANNCSKSIPSIEIDAPDPITIQQFDLTTIVCNGETASLDVQAIGGSTSMMTYDLYKGSETTPVETKTGQGVVPFSGLVAGSYTLKIWSDLNCEPLTRNFQVQDRRKLVVTADIDTINLLCDGDPVHTTLSLSGEAPYTYTIEGTTVVDVPITGNSVDITTGLSASVTGYQNRIIVNDNYGCENDVYVTAFQPTPLVVGLPVVIDETCREKDNGRVSITVTGGTPGRYEVQLGDKIQRSSDGVIEFYNIPAGIYNMTIKDKNGCFAQNPPTNIEVKEPADQMVVSSSILNPIKCWGEQAEVQLNVTGGWGTTTKIWLSAYGYTADTIVSGNSLFVNSGNYTIKARNNDGCTASAPLEILQPFQLRLQVTEKKNVSCNGFDDARIVIKATGGTQPYSWDLVNSGKPLTQFPGNEGTAIIENEIEAGVYPLLVSDVNNCISNEVQVTITEPDPVVFTVRQGNPTDSVDCYGGNDGQFVLTANGGNPGGYRSYIAPLNGTEADAAYPTIANLTAGVYTLRVSDISGCFSEEKLDTIHQPDEIIINSASIVDSVLCFGNQNGSIEVDAVGGLPYGLQYKLTGVDFQNSNVNKNYQNSALIEGLRGGNYYVYVRNSKGNCEQKFAQKITVVNPDSVFIRKINKLDVTCHNMQNGSVFLEGEGGTGMLTYQLVGAPSRISPNPNTTGRFESLGEVNQPSTTYNYRVEDRNGCYKNGNFSIINPEELVFSLIESHQVYCNNQSNGWIIAKAVGGMGSYTYKNDLAAADTIQINRGEYENLNDNRVKILKLAGGQYQPMVIDKNGCTDTISTQVTIVNPPPLKIAMVTPGEKRCYDSKDDSTIIVLHEADFGTRGEYTYTIDNWKRTITTKELEAVFVNLRDTMIYAQVKDTMGCVATWEDLVLEWPEAFNVTINKLPITCWDNQYGRLALEIEGGIQPYYFGVDDIAFANPVIVEKEVPGDVVLDTIVGKPENRYFYMNVNTDIYVKDAHNCIAYNTPNTNTQNPYFYRQYVWEPVDTFEVLRVITTAPNCNYEDAQISVVANDKGVPSYTYWAEFPNGENVDSTSERSILKVRPDEILLWNVADFNKCIARIDPNKFPQGRKIYIPANADTIEVNYTINDDERPECPFTKDGIVRVDVKGFAEEGVEVRIFKTDTTFLNFNPFDPSHTYVITPEERDSFYYYEKENELTGEIVYGDTLYIVNNDSIDYLFEVGNYYIEYEDIKTGCFVTTTFTVDPQDTICPDNYDLVFSPNGDNYNDEWILNDLDLKNASLKIFNSEGELVYHFPKGGLGFASGGLKWRGFDDKDRPVPAGTYMYVYYMDAVDTKVKYGTITLIRGRD